MLNQLCGPIDPVQHDSMNEIDIRLAPPPMGPIERDPVMDILALAFSNDPAVRYMFPTAAGYLANFNRLATAMAGSALAGGHGLRADAARRRRCGPSRSPAAGA